jgi:integrase
MIVEKYNERLKCKLYFVRIRNEEGKKQLFTPGHTSKTVAKEYERKLINEIAEKKMFPERNVKKWLFKDFMAEYLKTHAENIRSTRNYKSTAKILNETFGEKHLHEINRYEIESYQSKRLKEVKVSTVNKDLAILKGMFTKAVDWGFLLKNPVKGIKLGRDKARLRYLTSIEANKLILVCRSEKLRSMIIIDIHCGLRKNELLKLKWKDVDFERNTIKVEEGKGGYTRFVPLQEKALKELLKMLNKKRGEYVFHDPKGKPFDDVKTSFNNAVERAGLEDVRFHDLRRTFATYCVFRKVAPKTLQKWMGHKSIETTMKYYVVSPDDFEQEEIKRLDGMVDTNTDTSEKSLLEDSPQTFEKSKADDGIRTRDLLITSELLYP